MSDHRPKAHRRRFEPSAREVEKLIEHAKRHSLGTKFLLHGAQDAVAATFQVHAFVVDAARAHLATRRPQASGTTPSS